ncbi:MAG: hypothetical protein ACTS73_03520 [Arsenophonus sp. NEOnobi-MAG3]
MPLITLLMFYCQGFQRSVSFSNEEAGKISKRTGGILRLAVKTVGVNKNDQSD